MALAVQKAFGFWSKRKDIKLGEGAQIRQPVGQSPKAKPRKRICINCYERPIKEGGGHLARDCPVDQQTADRRNTIVKNYEGSTLYEESMVVPPESYWKAVGALEYAAICLNCYVRPTSPRKVHFAPTAQSRPERRQEKRRSSATTRSSPCSRKAAFRRKVIGERRGCSMTKRMEPSARFKILILSSSTNSSPRIRIRPSTCVGHSNAACIATSFDARRH